MTNLDIWYCSSLSVMSSHQCQMLTFIVTRSLMNGATMCLQDGGKMCSMNQSWRKNTSKEVFLICFIENLLSFFFQWLMLILQYLYLPAVKPTGQLCRLWSANNTNQYHKSISRTLKMKWISQQTQSKVKVFLFEQHYSHLKTHTHTLEQINKKLLLVHSHNVIQQIKSINIAK